MATTNAAYKFDYNEYCLQRPDFYRPQRSWGKVIFSQASVILSTGGHVCLGGMCAWGGMCGWGVCMAGGAWQGACMAGGGHVWPGACVPRGHAWPGGMHAMHTPWPDAMRYGRSMSLL